jgi:hypothetical protein
MKRSTVGPALVFALLLSGPAVGTRPAAAAPGHPAPEHAAAAAAALGVGDYEVDGVEVALLSVKRVSDGTLTVKWEYRNKAEKPEKLGESFKGMGWSEPFSLVYDAYLVDARNRMKYPVVKDTKGNLVAGKHGGKGKVFVLEPGRTLVTWAKFIAVPPDVKKISVFIPGVAPFEDVPIGD